jgi:hypothetical protein
MDNRGCGFSDAPANVDAYTTTQMANDALCVVNACWPNQKFIVVGQSLGIYFVFSILWMFFVENEINWKMVSEKQQQRRNDCSTIGIENFKSNHCNVFDLFQSIWRILGFIAYLDRYL